jgi:hypothetical protein
MPRARSLLLACVLAGALAPAALGAAHAARPAPRLPSPVATAKRLVTQFFTEIKRKDVAGLRRLLSPAFQIQRADGSSSGRTQYLKKLPTLLSFRLARFVATQTGAVLVVRYLATATGTVNGKPYTPGPAPRLSVFSWNGSMWQLVAHANFNPLKG